MDFLADFEHVAGAGDTLDPGEFGDMDETFDAAFDFDECAIREELGDAAADVVADGVLALNVFPWVLRHLLETQRDAFLFAVHIEDDHIHRLANVQQFGRMVDAAPRHVCNVQQAVHSLEIDECTKIGDILDRTGDLVPNFDGLEEALAKLRAFGLDDLAAGQHDVFALVVDLDDFEFVNVADVFVEILGRNDVHLRTGQEGFHADVDRETAFDDGFDLAADQATVLEDLDDLFPVLLVGGFFLGEDDHALFIFEFFEEDFDFVADFDFLIFEFIGRDGSFGFVADVDENDLGADFENRALDDRPFAEFAKFGVDQFVQFYICGFRENGTHDVFGSGLC